MPLGRFGMGLSFLFVISIICYLNLLETKAQVIKFINEVHLIQPFF